MVYVNELLTCAEVLQRELFKKCDKNLKTGFTTARRTRMLILSN